MSTNYPTSLDSYTAKTDGVDDVLAAHVNNLQDAIVAIETKIGIGNFIISAGDGATWGFKAGESSDVLLYRSAADTWRTPDSLTIDVGINVGTASGATAGQIRASAAAMLGGVTSHQFSQQVISSLADHGKAQLGIGASDLAVCLIIETNLATMSMFVVRGVTHSVIEVLDPTNVYTTTEDNDTTTNVYWDAGNSRYELNNEVGGVCTYYVYLFRVA